MKIRPWGPAHWLMPKIGNKQWHLITSASFEDRCTAVADWMSAEGLTIASSTLLKISNPPSPQWTEASAIVDANAGILVERLSASPLTYLASSLLSPMTILVKDDPIKAHSASSVVLDITTLPKRFFLFAFKRLMDSAVVQDLVVTYARAATYPETPLCEDALPPAAFQGFGRIEPAGDRARMVVGVGYVPLSVGELLERAKTFKLDFIFPFPPASPASRRNWRLLSMLLLDDDIPRDTEIHRIHALDPFEVFDRVTSWAHSSSMDIDMIPLGPKPHALGMAMAYMRLGGRAELIYSQPQVYGAKYSEGVAIDANGRPEIVAYCLKKAGKAMF